MMPIIEGVSPPGMEDVVRRLKEQPGVDNPWAIAWSIFHKQVGQVKALSDRQLAEAIKQFHAERQAGTLLAFYQQAADGNINAQAILMSPGAYRFG